MKRIKKFLSLLLIAAITMQICAFTPVNALAAEATPLQASSRLADTADEEMVLIDAAEIGSDADITPYASYHYLINKGGVYSSDVSIPFSSGNLVGNVKLVVNFEYHDGHTGTVKVQCAGYNYTVAVDGESHVVDTGMTINPGDYIFKITGVDSTMTVVVYLYAVFST